MLDAHALDCPNLTDVLAQKLAGSRGLDMAFFKLGVALFEQSHLLGVQVATFGGALLFQSQRL